MLLYKIYLIYLVFDTVSGLPLSVFEYASLSKFRSMVEYPHPILKLALVLFINAAV